MKVLDFFELLVKFFEWVPGRKTLNFFQASSLGVFVDI